MGFKMFRMTSSILWDVKTAAVRLVYFLINTIHWLVMLKLFTGEELLWSGITVGGWACPADVLESIFIDGYRNLNPCTLTLTL